MPKIIQRLQDIGFRFGAGLTPGELEDCYTEHIADGWSILLNSEYNLIAILYPTGLITINAEIIGNPEMFWDATKKLIADELATVTSKQLSLF